jgi:hypothetical protein
MKIQMGGFDEETGKEKYGPGYAKALPAYLTERNKENHETYRS